MKTTPKRILLIGVAFIALLHCALWFTHYNQTALGESPALDNRQTLELAHAMAEGRLAEEPFHRAPFYPYILSLFLSIGLPYELLPLIARWLNALALALIAASTSHIARQVWGRTIYGWLAGLLVALNPVLVFFAGDAFDILLATAPLVLAVALLPNYLSRPSLRLAFGIGVLLALGAALRSHILPLALIWPIAASYLAHRQRYLHALLSALPALISFLLLGLTNLQVSGQFRLMPWQGAYNLWAGNGPEASGRIYAQKIRVDFDTGYDNPAKLESITLYEQETGARPPHSIDAMNAHWKQKFFDHIAESPVQWLSLMARKAYYLLNSYEQYDNKTYSFHQQRHPLLKYNPIHWGALLLLAVGGTLIGLRNTKARPFILVSIILFALYAAGTILFYTSNRFRLPMLPLLSILSVGMLGLPETWKQAKAGWRTLLVVCLLATFGITYSGFFDARKTDTWEEDYALLANASLRTARDEAAILNARAALEMNPGRSDMSAVLAQAHFNQWALAEEPNPLSARQVNKLLQLTRHGSQQEPHLTAVAGIYEWKLGQDEAALATWQNIAAHDALARLCLIRTGRGTPPSEKELPRYQEHPSFSLLLTFTTKSPSSEDSQAIAKFIDALLSPAESTSPHASPDET